jgi:adenylate cyclase class IV
MPRNVEIKARIVSVEALLPRAQALAGGAAPVLIEQDDQFFPCAHGRLKLRALADGTAELIAYDRADTAGPKLSDYVRAPVADAAALRQALARALGDGGRVVKQRWLLMAGPTRIHLDRVRGLGDFLELEVVLRDGQTVGEGEAIAHTLLAALGVDTSQLLRGAYRDLLASAKPHAV